MGVHVGDEKRPGTVGKQSPEEAEARRMPTATPQESERAGSQRGAAKLDDYTAPHPTGASAPSPMAASPEEEPLLGKPPRIDEGERPAIGQSSSQSWPGAVGPHANPVAGAPDRSHGAEARTAAARTGSRAPAAETGTSARPPAAHAGADRAANGGAWHAATDPRAVTSSGAGPHPARLSEARTDVGSGSRAPTRTPALPEGTLVLGPGEVLPPHPAPDMTATGAAENRHPPAPHYSGAERRIAQQDWDRWRAEDRRAVPFLYPEWRT